MRDTRCACEHDDRWNESGGHRYGTGGDHRSCRRERNLRERVTYMLWVMANQVR